MPLLLGYDLGSSSVKVALLDAATGQGVGSALSPETEMPIATPRAGWAEQDPARWWQEAAAATRKLQAATGFKPGDVAGIGISYQMHGLVCLDNAGEVVRPSIIWCDSRAVETGARGVDALGADLCLARLLNLPGNFTAAKLAWVREHEPQAFARVARILLPGDWLAFRMTGRAATTASGLSEGILWDFAAHAPSPDVLAWAGLRPDQLGDLVPTFGPQGTLTAAAAAELGLLAGTPVCYRAGDQPNNAFSLGAIHPGDVAATAGTSGVVYAVGDRPAGDAAQRWNVFAHVNHAKDAPRYGALLCLNGAGITYSWLRKVMAAGGAVPGYAALDALAAAAAPGSDGLTCLPFGNGAERMLGNRTPGGLLAGIDFNRQGPGEVLRAALEGVAFALAHGLLGMREAGIPIASLKAGRANLFLSPLFRRTLATVAGVGVTLHSTDGALGAARGAGVGCGCFADLPAALAGLEVLGHDAPDPALAAPLQDAFGRWRAALARQD